MTRGLPRRLVLPFFAWMSACAGPAASTSQDLLHERIRMVQPADDGSAVVAFEFSQRYFRIDPVLSPEAPAMLAFAQAAMARGDLVHATVAPSGARSKGDDGPPFVLLRLAMEPAPSR